MPKYEVGYILSSAVADDGISNTIIEISKSIESVGGRILNEDHWGRRKLAYPIGRTRNGYYAFLTVDLPPEKVREAEHKLLTNDAVIRFIIVNTEEADRLKTRDEAVRAASGRTKPVTASVESPAAQANLDEEIEKAISGEQENV